jgi:acyl carrier protein
MDKQLMKLMAELLRVPQNEITDTLTMNETDSWDSLKHMELVVTLEETFDVQLTADEIITMLDMKGITKVLTEKGALN